MSDCRPDSLTAISGPSRAALPRAGVSFAELFACAQPLAAAHHSVLTDGTVALSYAELAHRIVALAEDIAWRGVAPGQVVALEAPNTVAGALVLLALLSRGLSVVLLPPDRTAARPPLPRFCRHSLVVRGQLADAARIDLDRVDSFLQISEHAEFAEPPAGAAIGTDKLLLRTSGSIGTPKLVMFGHRRLLANAVNVIGRLQLRPDDRIAIPVPLTHMFGLGAGFLPGLASGASIDLVEAANLLRYAEHERRFRPTVAFLTPALCFMIARQRGAPDHYRHVVVAGDKLTPETFELAERRFGRVVNLYGCTELGAITAADPSAEHDRRSTTSGTALPGVALRIDPRDESDQPDQPGQPDQIDDGAPDAGGVMCRHPFGFDGYVTADGEPSTDPQRVRDGWYRSGDLGRVHPGGLLEVLGRADHSVNRHGRLVMLGDVERAMAGLPGVERVVTVLGSDGLRGRDIIAFCVPREGHTLDRDAIRDACARVLPAYAIPDHVRIIAGVPMLPNGKVDRGALSALTPASHTSAP